MNKLHLIFFALLLTMAIHQNIAAQPDQKNLHIIKPVPLKDVQVKDSFWSPMYRVWNTVTVDDVLNKLEGRYIPSRQDTKEDKKQLEHIPNALLNFDLVAQGKKNIDTHEGPPWYDGLLYETIRGAADLLVHHPDKKLEAKIDGYINRIAAAQAADPDGYINTYTTLTRPEKRWGQHGGDDKWQHDVYNAGMLAEAAVHYYNATHKTKLLAVAVKMTNYMCKEMGPSPKKNVVPGHGGPEEAMIKMYRLFKREPQLKAVINLPVDERQYYNLAKFWIEQRGHYGEPGTSYARASDSSYNQDHMPVLQQPSIEGHAVRATLLATGVTTMAIENKSSEYSSTANRYWDNMIGKRMFITGGEGAVAEGERFGADYFLPESAYLETCASIGAGFFSEQMNELEADGKYIDELERVVYNNLLSGISLSGNHYHYENPLITSGHPRWAWHGCPCCPPMILKMVGALPSYIYASGNNGLYVNLFIGSEATVSLSANNKVRVLQKTGYPWKGNSRIELTPAKPEQFTVYLRIPGWALGKENPFDLYYSKPNGHVSLLVNGRAVDVKPVNGYASVTRTWKKGDIIELNLPVEPRVVLPNESVESIKGKLALAAGPVIYGIESTDNAGVPDLFVNREIKLSMVWRPGLLNGVNVISGTGINNNAAVAFKAVPFFSIGNREVSSAYKVWLPIKE